MSLYVGFFELVSTLLGEDERPSVHSKGLIGPLQPLQGHALVEKGGHESLLVCSLSA